MGYAFATLVVEEEPDRRWSLTYVFLSSDGAPWVYRGISVSTHATAPRRRIVRTRRMGLRPTGTSAKRRICSGCTSRGIRGSANLFCTRIGREGVNPMRRSFDAHAAVRVRASPSQLGSRRRVRHGAGRFAMPIGPVFSDFAESAHFLLETVGEDVIRTIPRFFYKYRGVEKIAEGQSVDRVLLLAERFSGTSAFAHGSAFCQAVEAICGIEVPPRAQALRTVFAELERLRHHAAAITGICNSTALAVATSQAALIEEDLLRLSAAVAAPSLSLRRRGAGRRLSRSADESASGLLATAVSGVATQAERALHQHACAIRAAFSTAWRRSASYRTEDALSYGLVGPVARASASARDIRKLRPLCRLRSAWILPFRSNRKATAMLACASSSAKRSSQSAMIVDQFCRELPPGPVRAGPHRLARRRRAGRGRGAARAPPSIGCGWAKAALVERYRITPPSFANWHGFHLAAENFAFQDFPIILASFGLSNAECDR